MDSASGGSDNSAKLSGDRESRHPRPTDEWHWTDIRLRCYEKLGYALIYMKYLHPTMWMGKQGKRVKLLCRDAAAMRDCGDEEGNRWNWWNLYRRIEDEIENMC